MYLPNNPFKKAGPCCCYQNIVLLLILIALDLSNKICITLMNNTLPLKISANNDKNKRSVKLVILSDQLQMDQKLGSGVDQELLEPYQF